MAFSGRKIILVFAGDIAVFVFSLWVTLLLRYQAMPSSGLFWSHFQLFWILFAVWVLVFYMAGLYGKRVLLVQYELTGALLNTQLLNITLAALFFFLAPGLGIAPKTNLIIYLVVSLASILAWRLWLLPRIARPASRERAALIGSGTDAQELHDEVNKNPRYGMGFAFAVSAEEATQDIVSFLERLNRERVSTIVVDTADKRIEPLLSQIYKLAFLEQRYQFADLYRMYEEVFDRVPLSLLGYEWFLKSVSRPSSGFYAFFKRLVDVIGALLMGVIVAILAPFVFIATRLEGPGPLFLRQIRFGEKGTMMTAYKFRTMLYDDSASKEWVVEGKQNRVTRVGKLMRRTSLDELPQFLNVLRGELSLIGPRNDIAGLGERLAESLPYYMARYMVKPGITGWAQINQRYEPGHISPQSIEETKVRLAYDFYYIRHRSMALDITVALKTFKRMLFRVSSF
jgi:exopolysaccharide biosynthesis polyprenyl glycosylphosphotransferase